MGADWDGAAATEENLERQAKSAKLRKSSWRRRLLGSVSEERELGQERVSRSSREQGQGAEHLSLACARNAAGWASRSLLLPRAAEAGGRHTLALRVHLQQQATNPRNAEAGEGVGGQDFSLQVTPAALGRRSQLSSCFQSKAAAAFRKATGCK